MRLTEEELKTILRKGTAKIRSETSVPPPNMELPVGSNMDKKIKHNFGRSHKYNAKKTERGEFKFDSQKEAKRYDKLILMKKNNEVLFFLRQVPFHLPGNVTYRIDFVIFWSDGHVSFEDVKGMKTPQYIMKKKMVESLYPIKIEEI
jgi:hypothetical protein